MKIGDLVTRKKYNNDVVFRITDIKDNIVSLVGVDVRLIADSNANDLCLCDGECSNDLIKNIVIEDNPSFNYIPGIILHLDSDVNYLRRCSNFYKCQNLVSYCFLFDENEYSENIVSLVKKYNPKIIVLTGHDSFSNGKYKNSHLYAECVRKIRKINSKVCVIAGACQSDFYLLMRSGCTFASSPKRVNVYALDPAIIASYLALSPSNKSVDIKYILEKTKSGSDGYGGIVTDGYMCLLYPRKE